MNKLSLLTILLATTVFCAGAESVPANSTNIKKGNVSMMVQKGPATDKQKATTMLSKPTGTIMKVKQGEYPQSVKATSINGKAQGGVGAMIMPPTQMMTGDAEIDAQLKALTVEMEAKIKAIHEEYGAKIKAILGDRPVQANPQIPVDDMKRDMIKKMEEMKKKQTSTGKAPEMPVYMDGKNTMGGGTSELAKKNCPDCNLPSKTCPDGKVVPMNMMCPSQGKTMQEGIGGIRYNNLFESKSEGGN